MPMTSVTATFHHSHGIIYPLYFYTLPSLLTMMYNAPVSPKHNSVLTLLSVYYTMLCAISL